MERIGECTGDRGGSWYHVYDGYFYKINSKREKFTYFKCAVHKCPGRANMPHDKRNQIVNNFKMTSLHNHLPNIHLPQLLALRRTLKARSESELTPLEQIFKEEIAKVHESVSELISYKSYRNTMHKHRHHVQKAIMNCLDDGEGGEDEEGGNCVEVSEIEYEENPVSEDESQEIVQLHNQLAVNSAKSKRRRQPTFSEPQTKKPKSFQIKEEIPFETSYLEEEEEQTGNTFDDENYDEYDYEDQSEPQNEDLEEYLKFYQTNPKTQTSQCNDLLSTFFKEMERTVRSFLPSVIIEAKGRIASLINKLEMKNWEVQQLLQQKELEKKKNQPKQKFLIQKEQIRREQEVRPKVTMILQKKKGLVQQQNQHKVIKSKEINQKLLQHQEVFQPELENQVFQLIEEQDQLPDEQNRLIIQQDPLVNDKKQTIQEPPTANSEFAGGLFRIVGSPARSTPANFLNVRLIKTQVVVPKQLDIVDKIE